MLNKHCIFCNKETEQVYVETVYRCEACHKKQTEYMPNNNDTCQELLAARQRIAELEENAILARCEYEKSILDMASDVLKFSDKSIELITKNSELSKRIAELETTTYCAYCCEKFVLDDEAATLVTNHIYTCEKHPMRLLEKRIAELTEQLRLASEDAERLAEQLKCEQNPGYSCWQLREHERRGGA